MQGDLLMKIEEIFDTSSNITIDSLLSMLVKQTLDKKLQAYYDTLLSNCIEFNSNKEDVC